MENLESYKLWHVLVGVAGLVVVYYLGTRGVSLLTQEWNCWSRRAVVTLSNAVLFAPSVAGAGHGGIFPMPAWMAAWQYATEGIWKGVAWYGVVPMLVTWAVFFVFASLYPLMSKNKNKKVDTHGKET